MNKREMACAWVSIAAFGAAAFAWSDPSLSWVSIGAGWVSLAVGLAAVGVLVSGRVQS